VTLPNGATLGLWRRCKHCQALQPVLEASARQLLDERSQSPSRGAGGRTGAGVCFGKVDATSAAGMFLGMRFFIGGFPRERFPIKP
jgi:hypothetical protein